MRKNVQPVLDDGIRTHNIQIVSSHNHFTRDPTKVWNSLDMKNALALILRSSARFFYHILFESCVFKTKKFNKTFTYNSIRKLMQIKKYYKTFFKDDD